MPLHLGIIYVALSTVVSASKRPYQQHISMSLRSLSTAFIAHEISDSENNRDLRRIGFTCPIGYDWDSQILEIFEPHVQKLTNSLFNAVRSELSKNRKKMKDLIEIS